MSAVFRISVKFWNLMSLSFMDVNGCNTGLSEKWPTEMDASPSVSD